MKIKKVFLSFRASSLDLPLIGILNAVFLWILKWGWNAYLTFGKVLFMSWRWTFIFSSLESFLKSEDELS